MRPKEFGSTRSSDISDRQKQMLAKTMQLFTVAIHAEPTEVIDGLETLYDIPRIATLYAANRVDFDGVDVRAKMNAAQLMVAGYRDIQGILGGYIKIRSPDEARALVQSTTTAETISELSRRDSKQLEKVIKAHNAQGVWYDVQGHDLIATDGLRQAEWGGCPYARKPKFNEFVRHAGNVLIEAYQRDLPENNMQRICRRIRR